jgi:hypothetical protein
MEDLNKQMLTDANKLEAFCDFVSHRIKNINISKTDSASASIRIKLRTLSIKSLFLPGGIHYAAG